jgi:segregation and condensation protein B
MNKQQQKIESLLFFKNQPLSFAWLARHLGLSKSTVKDDIEDMKQHYVNRGIELVVVDDEVSLVTSRDQRELIESIEVQESAKELSKQALETLAIILYKKQVTKSEIDFIRGVNSVYILRNLMIRGLINKKANPADKRSPLYIPSIDLFSFLGITDVSELDGYDAFQEKLSTIHEQYLQEQTQEE